MSQFEEPMAGKGKTPLENAYLAFADKLRKAGVNWCNIPLFRDWVEADYADHLADRAELVRLLKNYRIFHALHGCVLNGDFGDRRCADCKQVDALEGMK